MAKRAGERELPSAGKPSRVGAVVLAGGHSRRMGCDKASLLLGNETFLQRISRTLAAHFQPLVIVCRPDQQAGFEQLLTSSGFDVAPVVIVDRAPERGPLEGLATALEYLADQNVSLAVISTCDAPLVQPQLLAWLASQLSETIEAVIPTDGQHLYGLTAAYQTASGSALRALLEAGHRRVIDLPLHLNSRIVTEEECQSIDPRRRSFLNANTPAEYQAICHQAAGDNGL